MSTVVMITAWTILSSDEPSWGCTADEPGVGPVQIPGTFARAISSSISPRARSGGKRTFGGLDGTASAIRAAAQTHTAILPRASVDRDIPGPRP